MPSDQREPRPPDSQLVDALANYLVNSRNKDDVRRAIHAWRQDAVHAGVHPETILIQFKKILLGLTPGQRSADYEKRLVDQREMILMCIEEYFSDGPSSSE